MYKLKNVWHRFHYKKLSSKNYRFYQFYLQMPFIEQPLMWCFMSSFNFCKFKFQIYFTSKYMLLKIWLNLPIIFSSNCQILLTSVFGSCCKYYLKHPAENHTNFHPYFNQRERMGSWEKEETHTRSKKK